MDLSIITYDSGSAQLNHLSDIKELARYQNDSKISWINLNGLKDIDAINQLGEFYGLHPLSVEDILHTEQQPKTETFENYRYLSIKTIQQEKRFNHQKEKKTASRPGKKKVRCEEIDEFSINEFSIDQISVIVMKNVLITFQEIAGDSFDTIRKKILEGTGEIRKAGIDYLAYAIIDAVVDEYFLTLNHIEDDIENFEDRSAKTNDESFIEEIQDTKKYLLQIKRAVSSLKSNINKIVRQGDFFQTDKLKPFLQDLSENVNNALVTVENYREWLSNIMDVNLSVLSHQTNRVMKVLTIISTIFIPLTFIVGIYGMNFEFMPELTYKWGYPAVLCFMGLTAITMILIFKFKRWF